MNTISTLLEEKRRLRNEELATRNTLSRLDALYPNDWNKDNRKAYEFALSYLYSIRARRSELLDELDRAQKIATYRQNAWKQTHPTLADIWPKGA